jgi:hypothetical protein
MEDFEMIFHKMKIDLTTRTQKAIFDALQISSCFALLMIVQAFQATKTFAVGSLMYPSLGFLRFVLMTTRQSRVSLKRHMK